MRIDKKAVRGLVFPAVVTMLMLAASPAATVAMAVGDFVVDRLSDKTVDVDMRTAVLAAGNFMMCVVLAIAGSCGIGFALMAPVAMALLFRRGMAQEAEALPMNGFDGPVIDAEYAKRD